MRATTLKDLPPPPPGKSGWPWDEESPTTQDWGSDAPRVSIVTPSYNQASFLEETLRSVLLQNYPNLEYIVMDGGSTDGSVEIIKKYGSHLAHWISEKDKGAADAICKGFLRTTGSILAYLNSDDPYMPGTLHAVVRTFQKNPDSDVVFGDTYWTDPQGQMIGERRQTPFCRLGYLYGGADLQQPSTFWSRDMYLKAGGMDPEYQTAFDTDLFFRFVACKAEFRHIKKYLSCFRIHPESKSSTLIEQRTKELTRLRSAHLRHPFHSAFATAVRGATRLHRTFWYVVQGDLPWLVSRVPDRLTAHRSGATVGPRAPYE